MKLLHRFAWIGVMAIAFVFAVGASGCGGSETGPHPGTGIVKGVDLGARKITLDHEDIPGFMKGMTMTSLDVLIIVQRFECHTSASAYQLSSH